MKKMYDATEVGLRESPSWSWKEKFIEGDCERLVCDMADVSSPAWVLVSRRTLSYKDDHQTRGGVQPFGGQTS